jgi:threonine/homoserine/homoserine lactone efflux protein
MLESSLSLANVLALLGALIVLAIIPSVSVLAVSARAAAFGFTHGMFTAFGIVIADIIFMGEQFTLIKYLGGVYLVWLGISLWRADARARKSDAIRQSSLGSSFLTGFLITLGDQKAILFYLGFFPAFIDLSLMTPTDTLIIIIIAIIGVGGAKLVYAYLADRASLLFKNTRAVRGINMLAGSVMIAVGVVLLLKAGQWM